MFGSDEITSGLAGVRTAFRGRVDPPVARVGPSRSGTMGACAPRWTRVNAEFKDGILKVHVAKSESAKPRLIDIQIS